MTDPVSIAIIAAAFFAGGAVKGLAGMGLPVITVALLTFAFGLPEAMALMVVPGIVTNIWQALSGGQFLAAVRRILPFLVTGMIFVWFGTGILVSVDRAVLLVILGSFLSIYAVIGISGFSVDIPPDREKWIAYPFGALSGVSTGMTGVTSVPSVIFLNGLGMRRDLLIQAMGTFFWLCYLVLTVSLWLRGLLSIQTGTLSFLAVLPALAGMWGGKQLRTRTSETGFKRLFFWVLLAMGLYLIVRAVSTG